MIFSFICPFVFHCQTILLGVVITSAWKSLRKCVHIIKSTRVQLVLIYDVQLFANENDRIDFDVYRFIRLSVGYFMYVLPTGIIGYIFLFVRSNHFICEDMKAPFLLDNNYKPEVNITELFELKRKYKLRPEK